jgi:hypothetical protein
VRATTSVQSHKTGVSLPKPRRSNPPGGVFSLDRFLRPEYRDTQESAYHMDDAELENLLNKIGKRVFVQYFREFGNSSISPQDVIVLLQNKEPFTLKSCMSRTYKSRRIFREGLEKQTLSIIAGSDRVKQKVADEARALLTQLRNHPV